jgi:hypothetical protein
MRKKNPLQTIFHSDSPNRLKGYEYFENSTLANMYNYAPIIHDAWVFNEAIRKQMISLYGKKQDLPKDFSNIWEVDIPIIVGYFKQWMPAKLHDCDCGRAWVTNDPGCGNCLEGKTGWRLIDYVNNHLDLS